MRSFSAEQAVQIVERLTEACERCDSLDDNGVLHCWELYHDGIKLISTFHSPEIPQPLGYSRKLFWDQLADAVADPMKFAEEHASTRIMHEVKRDDKEAQTDAHSRRT